MIRITLTQLKNIRRLSTTINPNTVKYIKYSNYDLKIHDRVHEIALFNIYNLHSILDNNEYRIENIDDIISRLSRNEKFEILNKYSGLISKLYNDDIKLTEKEHAILINVVSKNEYALAYIQKNQTQELCLTAIKKAYYAIRYISPEYKTDEIIKIAIDKYFEYNKKYLSENMINLSNLKLSKLGTNSKKLYYHTSNASFFDTIPKEKQTYELCKYIIDKFNDISIISVLNQSYELCKYAIMKDPDAKFYIDDKCMTEEQAYELRNL